jgi:hypothetical protein
MTEDMLKNEEDYVEVLIREEVILLNGELINCDSKLQKKIK